MCEVAISEKYTMVMGQSPKGNTYNNVGEGLPLLNGPTEFGDCYPECTLYTTDSKRECEPGDLIFCVRGSTTGRMNWANRRYSLGRGVCVFRGVSKAETRYLRYCLERNLDKLLKFAGGGTFPNLTKDTLLDFKIPYQKERFKIAAILSAYDDLIENNNRRIKILEQMAQTIYDEWFVKFRFPAHENVKMVDSEMGKIPEGWENKNLFDISEVIYGYPFQSNRFAERNNGPTPIIRIRDLQNGITQTYTDEKAGDRYVVRNGDILVGMDGDFHMCRWASGKAYLNQRVALFRPMRDISPYFLFWALKKHIEYFGKIIVGTTVAHLGDSHLRTIEILTPPSILMNKANKILLPLYELGINLFQRNINLRLTRDILLPKLISGEIDVEDMDIDIGDVNDR